MKKINKNELAVKIAKKEAGKKQVNIAQIKEILKSLIDVAIEEGMITEEMFQAKKEKMKKILVKDAYRIAIGEIGIIEVDGEKNNPRIIEYHQACDSKFTSDSVPWCSAFVNWCIQKAGGKGTRSAMARSWLGWGKSISKPFEGCLVVFERGTDGVSGHVGFYVKESKSNIWVLGGNQGNEVDINAYTKSRLLGYRSSLDLKS